MERIIRRVDFAMPVQPKATKVAAYARVSSGKDTMLHSLSAQVSHYSEKIQNHRGWVYSGVFSDEAFTGTKEDRKGFQELLAACRAGKVDMVITKSISRFARNTVTLLSTVRELKLLGVDVYFEEQNIHTMSADGELLMTILASYAQEESRSVSENMKWRVKKNFEEGIPWNSFMLGYRLQNGRFEIIPEEAEVVRRIFAEYLAGKGYETISRELNADGLISPRGVKWGATGVGRVIKNYAYTGNLILQKTYSVDHLTKKMVKNEGQLPKYYVEDSHEAIISPELFQAAQEERERRARRFIRKPIKRKSYPFSSMLRCENCGKNYSRKITANGPVWICTTFNTKGKAHCASKQIPEEILTEVAKDVAGVKTITRELLKDLFSHITVCNGNVLVFHFKDGRQETKTWADRSRARSWTPEMRDAARENANRRWSEHG